MLPMKSNDLIAAKTSTRHLTKKIMKIADLHDMLNTILDKVNECYSIQVNFMTNVSLPFFVVIFASFSQL